MSVDRTTEALTKAQTEVQRVQIVHDTAKSTETRAQAEVFRAQAVEEEARAQRESVTRERDSIVTEMLAADYDDLATLQRLGIERSTLDAQLIALEGALTRAQSEHAKARTDLDVARAALARAEEAQRSAVERHQEAQALAEESRLVAALDPGALRRKAARERQEAILAEHTRIVRSHGAFSPGGGPPDVLIEAEKVRTRHFARPPLDANAVGWGTHAEVRNVSPVGPRGSVEPARADTPKPYNTQDPLSNE